MKRIALISIVCLMLLAACAPAVQTAAPQEHAVPTQLPAGPTALPPTLEPTAIPPTPTVETLPTAGPTQSTPDAAAPTTLLAIINAEGNVALISPSGSAGKTLSADATPRLNADPKKPNVTFCCASWSSDGRLLAYQRYQTQQKGTEVTNIFELWVYDVSSGQSRVVLQNEQTAGYAWQPGTHRIAYGQMVDPNYFTARGQNDPARARGILSLDVDTGEKAELVKPERGLSIVSPVWSPDGRYLSFDEVLYMEGRGQFACYDFQGKKYTSWEKVIGGYAWAPDSQHIVYDHLAYNPSGDERIWISDLQGQNEQSLSPRDGPLAYGPVFSPKGDFLAYHAQPGGPASGDYDLMVVPAGGGEAKSLGSFPELGSIAWAPDGKQLAISYGPYENSQLKLVSLADGSTGDLGPGSFPVWQPLP
ncbi:MAG TPA: hypothetical protein VMT46_15240 [Anaerolineaceae bacterium]|nr:hypothetical protein [Anaerolineaceae bacterium]